MNNFNYHDFDVVLVETVGDITRTVLFKSFEDFQTYENGSEVNVNNPTFTVRFQE